MTMNKMRAVWAVLIGVVLLTGISLWLGYQRLTTTVPDSGAFGDAPVTGARPVARQGSAGDDGALEAVEGAVDHAVRTQQLPVRRYAVVLTLADEMRRREQLISSLPAYSEKEAALKHEIRESCGGEIAPEMVDGLLSRARLLTEEYWTAGDFNNARSFDSIYKARAILELCLEAAPADEGALRQMIEVLGAGWPFFLSSEKMETASQPGATGAQRELLTRNYEGYYALYTPLWTLWSTHLSQNADATLDDLAVAADLLTIQPPDGIFASVDEEYRRQHPGANLEEVAQARMRWHADQCTQVARWASEASRRKGSDWEVIANAFEGYLRTGFYATSIRVNADLSQSPADEMHYWGRLQSFTGPKSRAVSLVPVSGSPSSYR